MVFISPQTRVKSTMSTFHVSQQQMKSSPMVGPNIAKDTTKYLTCVNKGIQKYFSKPGMNVNRLEILITFNLGWTNGEVLRGKTPRKRRICGWTLFLKRAVMLLKEDPEFDGKCFTMVSRMWNEMIDGEKQMWKEVATKLSRQEIVRLDAIRIQEVVN